MSTFYGGVQLTSVTPIDAEYSTNATLHTVASGYYAEIIFSYIGTTGLFIGNVFIDAAFGNIEINNSSQGLIDPSVHDGTIRNSLTVIANAGDALKVTSTVGTPVRIKAMIFTYKKP